MKSEKRIIEYYGWELAESFCINDLLSFYKDFLKVKPEAFCTKVCKKAIEIKMEEKNG